MTTDPKPSIVEIHPVGPAERTSRSVLRKDGGRVELRITPIADCATCSKSIQAVACSCCGDGFLGRLAIAHGHGALLCMVCLAVRTLGKPCSHAAAEDDPLMRLVGSLERHAMD